MAIPEFYHFIRPTLALLADGEEHHLRDVERALADQFHLTPEDREELLPSKTQTRFNNRVAWAL